MAQRDQALHDEGAVQPGERDHVADRAERDQVEEAQEIGQRAGEAAPPQLAQQRDGGEEGHADRGELALAGNVVRRGSG